MNKLIKDLERFKIINENFFDGSYCISTPQEVLDNLTINDKGFKKFKLNKKIKENLIPTQIIEIIDKLIITFI